MDRLIRPTVTVEVRGEIEGEVKEAEVVEEEDGAVDHGVNPDSKMTERSCLRCAQYRPQEDSN